MNQAAQKEKQEVDLYSIRHSLAHIMAQAVVERFPGAKFTIGPAIDNGFYYDFDLSRTLTPEDLEAVEKRMRQIIAGRHSFVRHVVSADEAKEIFKDQPYKLELIRDLEAGEMDEHGNPITETPEISTYTSDTFTDLCRGPHVENTSQINPSGFKLMSVAGAYWRGDEHNPMLQRVYGTAWRSKQELESYLQMLEEAKKRDHRKLGRELDIFVFDEEVGPGLPLWLPRGGILIEELEKLAKEVEMDAGYDRVRSPHLTKEDLFGKSVDEINEKIFERYKDTPLEQVEAFFDLAHQLMLAALEQTSDKDLSRRYPTSSDPTEGATLLSFIAGDTYEHYREHVEWIRPWLPNGGR